MYVSFSKSSGYFRNYKRNNKFDLLFFSAVDGMVFADSGLFGLCNVFEGVLVLAADVGF